MATKRDLVEAHAFSRRRLVTAFVSGAPGGREVEPVRPGRTIVGGLALSVLLIAGAAIAGVFAPRTPDGWLREGLVVSRETPDPYVVLVDPETQEPILHPVINITSAKLILGADARPRFVPQEAIDSVTPGRELGILGAPRNLPPPERLVGTGWTACLAPQGGLRLRLGADALRPVPGGAYLVRSGATYYLVAQSRPSATTPSAAHRFLLPSDGGARDNLLAALGVETSAEAAPVSPAWLALVPQGAALELGAFGLLDFGEPLDYSGGDSGIPGEARVGDVLDVAGEELLLTGDGPAGLQPFEAAVYDHVPAPPHRTFTPAEPPKVPRADLQLARAHWPDQMLAVVFGEHCLRLEAGAGVAPSVTLGTDPPEGAAAEGLAPGAVSVLVDSGRGAYVRSGDWSESASGSQFVVDANGIAYPLDGPGAAGYLGYDAAAAPLVPDSWMQLFAPGVTLSRDAALCPPGREPGQRCG